MNKSQEMMELVDCIASETAALADSEGYWEKGDYEKTEDKLGELKTELQSIADTIPQWISVEDRLPEESVKKVWTGFFMPDGEFRCEVEYKRRGKTWKQQFEHYPFTTHWMPLPQPPDGEKR